MTDLGVPVSQISGIALESVPGVAEADPDFIYLVLALNPARVIKMRYSNFDSISTLILPTGESTLGDHVNNVLTYGNYAFFPIQSPKGRLIKVDLSTMTRVGYIDLSPPLVTGIGTVYSASKQDEYGYWVAIGPSSGNTDCFWKVNLETFLEVSRTDLTGTGFNGDENPKTILTTLDSIFPVGGDFLRYDIVGPTYSNRLNDLDVVEGVIRKDGLYGYFTKAPFDYSVDKVRLTGSPYKVATLTFSSSAPLSRTVAVDLNGRFAIWAEQSSGKLWKLDMYSDSWYENITVPNVGTIISAKRIGNHVLFGDDFAPGLITKISINPLQYIDQAKLTTGNNAIKSIVTI